ncbi:MAG TPA: cob(I)yrinic acid a,c-diamide adenosyltransferase [Yinghuangia sp.]|uniref:cob(I)yrinic acid a,c-diamide adenosyltransferase n=1 Tax=Yinghuangia sp. YIM S10712 TaxID=3436930 RepID=UPI002BAF5598|nr:cob(I)yrinic acid a,c-diamide adenosyltransferase [Yinghuangia sp.]
MSVVLSRIYTRTGDAGTTALGDNSRVRKTDSRLAAYADTDEANSAIGVALALGGLDEGTRAVLAEIQHDLFDVGADLCTPVKEGESRLRIRAADTARLEAHCDTLNERLEALRSFVLPGGTPGAALLHQARTVARRAERSAWALLDADAAAGGSPTVNPETARYLNRLSDLLFVLARAANQGDGPGDVLWEPGRSA